MSVLLDTHLWLWWLLGSPQLTSRQRRAIDQAAQARQLRLAAISLWEAQMLQAKESGSSIGHGHCELSTKQRPAT